MISSPTSRRCSRHPAPRACRRAAFAAAISLALNNWCHAVAASQEGAAAPSVYTHWRMWTVKNGLPHDDVRSLRTVGDGVWVGTRGGLASIEGDTVRNWTASGDVPVRWIDSIDADPRTGDLWLGSLGDGLWRFSAGRFDRFHQRNSGLAGDVVFAVLVDQGRIWAATNGGLCVYDPSRESWEVFEVRRATESERAITELRAYGGAVYGWAYSEGVRYFDSQVGEWAFWPAALQPSAVQPILRRRALAGALAPFMEQQAWRWTRESARFALADINNLETAPHSWLHCGAVAESGTLWLGGDGGLTAVAAAGDWRVDYRRSDAKMGSITLHRAGGAPESRYGLSTIPDNAVRCIAPQIDRIWVGTPRGLARGSDPRPFDAVSAISGPTPPVPAFGGSPPSEEVAPPAARERGTAIAVFGPVNRVIAMPPGSEAVPLPNARGDYLAVLLAVERAIARGGLSTNAAPSLLTGRASYAAYGWGLPEDELIEFSRDTRVVGVIGSFPPARRIADAVLLRAELPAVTNTTPALDGAEAPAHGPWTFACRRDEPRRQRMLLDHLIDDLGCQRLALLSDPDEALAAPFAWWRDHLRARGLEFDHLSAPQRGKTVPEATLAALRLRRPDAVLTGCSASVFAGIVRDLRRGGIDALVVGGSDVLRGDLVAGVGAEPGPVLALKEGRTAQPGRVVREFDQEYTRRNCVGNSPRPPKDDAYESFAATDHLLEAVRRAGPERGEIRKALEGMSRSIDGEAHYEQLYEPLPLIAVRWVAGRWVDETIPAK